MLFLKVTMDKSKKWWWQLSDSVIEHNNHHILCSEPGLTGESDLTPDQMKFIQQLYSHGVIPSIILDIMS